MGLRTNPSSEGSDGRGRHGGGVSAEPARVSAMLDILASGRLDAHQQGVPVDADPPRQRQLGWLALQTVLAQPFGKFLLTAVALGFAAFGLFAILRSRYRRM
ncbi:MAG: hypothetical protein DLM61_22525 [Pseudonocardiales bacterium]|nr:DUF1206 domain-containing protein [Pseudonocardiales bacterium]PZS24288.1 MAG: hypothetical protein DLM61_22525 [Pseudonocardiales bacterium]